MLTLESLRSLNLINHLEWNSDYLRRFGLYYVDYLSQQRIPKESALWYRDWMWVCV
ncbi:family 1 glycosylhydrolase [Undibacterium sp. LX40W]|uniref:Family 1 glycosylhydrolase n=1 Tax=Undibacterium nitidum TaxID=2762298 RepID=A0A923HWY8_9BURK|nr:MULTISPECIES: family 1 glycosylhydrolase [Undibacterium]MBC3882924.1 family 1 glycosylhydrolase [Undibacterium nitidum]MBC3893205.1 family 1 glycosylhydrolase [Undibacterium sp. LX40W]